MSKTLNLASILANYQEKWCTQTNYAPVLVFLKLPLAHYFNFPLLYVLKKLEMLRKSISYSFLLDYFACGIRELHALPTTFCNTEERNLKEI
jgi:hypothetical protein